MTSYKDNEDEDDVQPIEPYEDEDDLTTIDDRSLALVDRSFTLLEINQLLYNARSVYEISGDNTFYRNIKIMCF